MWEMTHVREFSTSSKTILWIYVWGSMWSHSEAFILDSNHINQTRCRPIGEVGCFQRNCKDVDLISNSKLVHVPMRGEFLWPNKYFDTDVCEGWTLWLTLARGSVYDSLPVGGVNIFTYGTPMRGGGGFYTFFRRGECLIFRREGYNISYRRGEYFGWISYL